MAGLRTIERDNICLTGILLIVSRAPLIERKTALTRIRDRRPPKRDDGWTASVPPRNLPDRRPDGLPGADGAFWVFAYGSLMWQPGFDFLEVRSALLRGYHRALCVYSVRYRGTPDSPGLVMGLDRAGSCRGRAYRVASSERTRVIDYLDRREMVTRVYRPVFLRVRLDDGRRVAAYCFVARRDHPQYAGGLREERIIEIVRGASGGQGAARDYLANTVRQLDALGIREGVLHRILARVDGTG
jgi:glutathione-specific gamma-glutamylcyclotransferase